MTILKRELKVLAAKRTGGSTPFSDAMEHHQKEHKYHAKEADKHAIASSIPDADTGKKAASYHREMEDHHSAMMHFHEKAYSQLAARKRKYLSDNGG